MDKRPKDKPIDWMGSSLEDLKAFPDEVMQTFGFELYYVQKGEMPHSATPPKDMEIIKKRLKLALEDSKKSTMAKEKTND
ncbi:MAG: hypothetical protein WBC26_09420 [Alphaproteobacteria bacterium]